MKAINTKYLGPSNVRGSRIKASDGDGHSITVSYPDELGPGVTAHASAAIALCKKMGWEGRLVSGGTKDGYVFCFSNSQAFDINLTPEEYRKAWAVTLKRLDAVLA